MDKESSPGEIEITSEMIEAGGAIIVRDEMFSAGQTWAEILAEEVIKAALKIHCESRQSG